MLELICGNWLMYLRSEWFRRCGDCDQREEQSPIVVVIVVFDIG